MGMDVLAPNRHVGLHYSLNGPRFRYRENLLRGFLPILLPDLLLLLPKNQKWSGKKINKLDASFA